MALSKTDRRTDKSTRWQFTAYEDQWNLFVTMPEQIAEWGWQTEECPTTGRKHYQGYLRTHGQFRLAGLRKILPGVHLEVALKWEALVNYCKKINTAVEGTKVHQVSERKYMAMHDSLLQIAMSIDGFVINRESKCWEADEYWFGVRKIISEEPFRIAQFSVPVMEKTWTRTREVWKNLARASVLQPAPPAPRICSVCNERMSLCGCSSEEDIPDSVSEIFLSEA